MLDILACSVVARVCVDSVLKLSEVTTNSVSVKIASVTDVVSIWASVVVDTSMEEADVMMAVEDESLEMSVSKNMAVVVVPSTSEIDEDWTVSSVDTAGDEVEAS